MFFNVFKNTLKILLRDKATVFWTVIFSILLAIMFKMAFSNLDKIDKLQSIGVTNYKIILDRENIEEIKLIISALKINENIL